MVEDRNPGVIAEYRARNGQPGGSLPPIPLLLLTTTGAKTGRRHTTPMGHLKDGERLVIFASHGGGATNPDWYHNLVANPTVTVELGGETFEAKAVVTAGEERARLYARQAAVAPIFAEYEAKAPRVIPVVALERIKG